VEERLIRIMFLTPIRGEWHLSEMDLNFPHDCLADGSDTWPVSYTSMPIIGNCELN
jgi:hypothetical protein